MRSIIESISRATSTRPPSRRQQASPTGSRRASRRLSALFQLREQNSVPLLNQKLLEHQEELRRTQNECNDKPNIVMQDAQKAFAWNDERTEKITIIAPRSQELNRVGADCTRKNEDSERAVASSETNMREEEVARSKMVCKVIPQKKGEAEDIKNVKPPDTARKKTWRIRLVDQKPNPACGNDEPLEQHILADDEVVSLRRKSHASLQEQQNEMPPPDSEEHECIWKRRFLEQRSRRLSIRGVTVLLHLEAREDVVFKAVGWEGGELRVED